MPDLRRLAEGQWGLFTRRQAEAAGLAWTTVTRLARSEATERVAHGVYRFRGFPPPDHVQLRAAWLQLAPDRSAWERDATTGVVSHRSAAALYGLGHLSADIHEFALPGRRQSRRPDVRLHRVRLAVDDCRTAGGLPVTTPARTAADLLHDLEDPGAVGAVLADSFRRSLDSPAEAARHLAWSAARFGLARGDGVALLTWLLDLAGAPEAAAWAAEAGHGA
ncbi:type IV toxin-antitoxin system AbiEi family antitoxin domain-containing protein [Dactylosporangium sp. AC04546]|uniref:type IV toxin-antitoxin system AbiEi family antitoxin domain-containing protein n=1 Tax=Dactylosporangium sp. AC04546 TaxID=2862460 RepID=UPI001EE0D3D2|nr:type IV toxin-antitoxin system AbiEi family antitoxin domain-containing protein [Dactylosporangium sp. AC04546]WVK83029.1 type IV toxin-antitoxin system AbiEi family antitoxin domain-containing protein [Dactylosporangium sp. AC04546]